MKTSTIIATCNNIKNGAFFSAHWATNCDKYMTAEAARSGHTVTKEVTTVCRKGVRYTHIKKARESKISKGQFVVNPETGEKEILVETRSWAKDVIPNLIIEHTKTGKQYMVVYTATNQPKVQYYLDGQPISEKQLRDAGIMRNSYWKESESPVVMTIPVESILEIK